MYPNEEMEDYVERRVYWNVLAKNSNTVDVWLQSDVLSPKASYEKGALGCFNWITVKENTSWHIDKGTVIATFGDMEAERERTVENRYDWLGNL